ncbi:hypothetical protein F5148DRAFT_1279471 [Russula earlei]|uniref:Uncharacterized protein n=1 Tax=Russula earlei TaxID=71964 RepID=A0ACC0UM20_9AGAM|nr:hypothetical protein F5148DRAFT_1279471 [Russula earlei]
MSISIDDLVSSFSASHVSQEAMDLATLQSQLAKVIYYPSQTQSGVHCVTRRNSLAQPCNTPTTTAAFHWEWDDATRYRGQSTNTYVAPAALRSCDMDAEMEEDDEQAVEDLLLERARATTATTTTAAPFSSALSPSLGSSTFYDATPVQSAPPSHFANANPFDLAAVQTAPCPSPLAQTAPSFFAQAARLTPNSPFNLNLSAAQQGHHALELESRTVLVGAGQSR